MLLMKNNFNDLKRFLIILISAKGMQYPKRGIRELHKRASQVAPRYKVDLPVPLSAACSSTTLSSNQSIFSAYSKSLF